MQYGVCLANIGTYADPRVGVRVAETAESAGWDGVFMWDHLAFVWGPPAADPWITLAAIAASTSRVRIGTAVTPVARRRPQVLAHQIATLDRLSGGRVVFGAGLGGIESEFGKFGEPTDARVRAELLDEGLELLRRLWSGEEVTHAGSHSPIAASRTSTPPPARPGGWRTSTTCAARSTTCSRSSGADPLPSAGRTTGSRRMLAPLRAQTFSADRLELVAELEE